MTATRDPSHEPHAWSTGTSIGRRFEGKVAFVTGGASGLGRAAAERFAREGARVVVADLDRSGAEAVASTLPDALAVEVDTASTAAVDRSFELALDAYGQIDVIFNNAGIVGPQMPLHETTDEAWRQVMAVNAEGAFHVLRRGLRAMLAGTRWGDRQHVLLHRAGRQAQHDAVHLLQGRTRRI